jgi:hypothetical protein
MTRGKGKEQPAPAERVQARVLVSGSFGVIDEVVELPAELLQQAVATGQVDPHPDAVAYALTLK